MRNLHFTLICSALSNPAHRKPQKPDRNQRTPVLRALPTEATEGGVMDVVEAALCDAGLWRTGGPDIVEPRDLGCSIEAMARYDRDVAVLHELSVSRERLRPFAAGSIAGPIASNEQLIALLDAVSDRFHELRATFDLWVPAVERHSERPYSARRNDVVRGFEREMWADACICIFDIIRSKRSPAETKRLILDALVANRVCHELTGDDAYIFVTRDSYQAKAVVESVRSRTSAYLDPEGYGGIRVSMVRGDAVVMRKGGALMVTDREGTPAIPRAAYPLDRLKDLLDSKSLRARENDGVVVDRRIADELEGAGLDIIELGVWRVKGLEEQVFFALPAIKA